MTNAEKLIALADDIKASFEREPWRDRPGMGYVEIQMDKDDEAEYRAIGGCIAQLEAERDALKKAVEKIRVDWADARRHVYVELGDGRRASCAEPMGEYLDDLGV